MGGLEEKDLEPVAELLAEGKVAEAAQSLAAVLTTLLTGHPLLGVLAGAGVSSVAKLATNTATKRFLEAGNQIDEQRARVRAYRELLEGTIAPLLTVMSGEMTDRMDDLFLQTIRVLQRDLASAVGQGELKQEVASLRGRLELYWGTPPNLRLRMRLLLESHKLFAGRDAELFKLDTFVTGPAGYMLVTGPSGSGKSALLAEWLERALSREGVVVAYHFIWRRSQKGAAFRSRVGGAISEIWP